MKINRIIDGFLMCAVTLAIGVIPQTVNGLSPYNNTIFTSYADSEFVTYKLVNDIYYEVSGCYEYAESVEIMSEYNGLPVKSIGIEAFKGCTFLTNVVIPDSIISIGTAAFSNCSSLESITIPDSVTYIGCYAFDDTPLLDNQTGIKYAGKWVIGCSQFLSSAEIKNGTENIADSVFANSIGISNLKSVKLPESMTKIGIAAFNGCQTLESITIPDSVTSIESNAFSHCESLTDIVIPEKVTSIGDHAFYGCISLADITIPESVKHIGEQVFGNCTNLSDINVSESNSNYSSLDGVLFNKDKTELIKYPEKSTMIKYDVPVSVKNIKENAFINCINLKSLTIPDSVTSIGGFAFKECTGLESITIPDSVTSIGLSAFKECTSLDSITIENPECEICDSGNTISNGIDENYAPYFNGTIYGYENSTAQAYAEKYDRNFVSLGEYVNVEIIQGDISGNGKIDIYDAIEICKSIMGMRTFTDEEKAIADYNSDGVVDLYDAIEIAKYILKRYDN